jgi:hypothetical protein
MHRSYYHGTRLACSIQIKYKLSICKKGINDTEGRLEPCTIFLLLFYTIPTPCSLPPAVRVVPPHSGNVTDGKIDEVGSQTGPDVAWLLPVSLLLFHEIVQKKRTGSPWASAQWFWINDENSKWFRTEWKHGAHGSVVVKALGYQSEGRRFETRSH